MTGQFLVASSLALISSICLGGSMRLYFRRQGEASGWQMAMKLAVGVASAVLYVALWRSRAEVSHLRWVGVCFLAAAQVLFWWSVRSHGRERPEIAFSDARPSRLVTWGPYRRIRHPFYTAYALAWIGAAFVSLRLELLVFTALLGLFYWRAARQEEREMLSGPLQIEYESYRSRTGMFWPVIRR